MNKNLKIKTQFPVFFNTCFDKNQIKNLVSWFLLQYGERETIKFLERLKHSGFYYATKAGISLGIEDLDIPDEKPVLITKTQIENRQIDQYIECGLLTNVEKTQYLIEIWNQTSDTLRQTAIQNFKVKNPVNPVYMMAFSGARGNVSQVRQLIAMRGLMADPQGAILEFPIQSNFREGLTITEYLISCYGARKGLVDTALRTATSGYLTRRLVDSAQHAVISIHDCKTKKYKKLEGANLESLLIGRVLAKTIHINTTISYLKNEIVSEKAATLIANIHKTVLIRSPLTCAATTSICQLCYGSNLSSGSLVQIGEAVGVIAAQSIGEPGTQLTMRTFHTGGVGVFSDQALKPICSPISGKISFFTSLPGHFVRTPNGKIVYMLKYTPSGQNTRILQVIHVENQSRCFTITENQLPPGSILFVKNGEYIQSKQLLAQASYIHITKQQLPESSHPVYSPLTGQIFYESMNLIIEKEKRIVVDTPQIIDSIVSLNSVSLPRFSEVRRMSKIGSFWVLSTSEKQEVHIKNPFVNSGDLISKKTVLSKYSFFSPYTQLVYIDNKKILFGQKGLFISIKANFTKKNTTYYLPKNENLGVFVQPYKSSSKNLILWYDQKSNTNSFKPTFINSFLYKNCTHTKISRKIFYLPQGTQFKFENKRSLKKDTQAEQILFSNTKFIRNKLFQYTSKNNNLKYTSSRRDTGNVSTRISSVWPIVDPTFNSTINLNEIIQNDKQVTNFSIPKYFTRITKSISVQKKPKTCNTQWYSISDFITTKKFQIEFVKNEPTSNGVQNSTYTKICIWYQMKKNCLIYLGLGKRSTQTQNEIAKNLIFIEKASSHHSITKYEFQKKLHVVSFSKDNSLIIKQKATKLKFFIYPKLKCTFLDKKISGYYTESSSFCIKIKNSTQNLSMYPWTKYAFQFVSRTFHRSLCTIHYYISSLEYSQSMIFKTYLCNMVSPVHEFCNGNIQSINSGEFLYKISKQNSILISLLQPSNIIKLSSNNSNCIKQTLGNLIRWGDILDPGYGSMYNGQIIKKSKNYIVLRLGKPILASARGIIHVQHNDFVDINQLIITLKSRRLQTEDIVQGIPKIEQLFEARESQSGEILSDTVHLRLRSAFVHELELLNDEHWSIAVEKSFLEAQEFLVESIKSAYSNQGVRISEKHIEIIVRQMTSRVRILESGETGLLPGELVQHNWIKRFNTKIVKLGLREATYEPIVLGISKSVLQSDSFLLAASFQEVSRVLIKSALNKKSDFLQGLHENVIVGQLIPAGTGLIPMNLIHFT